MADIDFVVLPGYQKKNTSFDNRSRPLPDLTYLVYVDDGTLSSSLPP